MAQRGLGCADGGYGLDGRILTISRVARRIFGVSRRMPAGIEALLQT
jgi:hypothetical protein